MHTGHGQRIIEHIHGVPKLCPNFGTIYLQVAGTNFDNFFGSEMQNGCKTHMHIPLSLNLLFTNFVGFIRLWPKLRNS